MGLGDAVHGWRGYRRDVGERDLLSVDEAPSDVGEMRVSGLSGRSYQERTRRRLLTAPERAYSNQHTRWIVDIDRGDETLYEWHDSTVAMLGEGS